MGRFDNILSGAQYPLINNLGATLAPTVTDDSDSGYEPGSWWVDQVNDNAYQCVDATVGAAIWKGTTPSGGAKSMVLSFASGSSKHVTTNSPTFASLAHFVYAGTDEVGPITAFNINAWKQGGGGGQPVDFRIVDLGTGSVIAEITGITSTLESNLVNMGTISSLPAIPSVLELQGKKQGGATAFVASLELEY